MRLEFLPIRELGGSRRVPKRRATIRLYLIIEGASRSLLSGGYTWGTTPT